VKGKKTAGLKFMN